MVDSCSYWGAHNSRLGLLPSLITAHLEKTAQGWNSLLTRGYGHVSETAFTKFGNPNKVFSTDNSPQLTFRFNWPARR